MINPSIAKLLACPASGAPLTLSGDKLVSAAAEYPLVNGVPWLFRNPDRAFLEWGTKVQQYVEEERGQLAHLQQNFSACENKLLKARLTKQHEARTKNLALMKKTLDPFMKARAIRITPSSQQIHSYFQLVFRDWCWDDTEITRYSDYVCEKMDAAASKVLILGSGAGGLSYRLAKSRPDTQFISVEHNPFLASIAEHLMQGKTLKLHDYSPYPRSLEQVSQKWEIKVDKLESGNHQTLLASFPDLPLLEQSFDVIVAPWFLDILEMPFPSALSSALKYLKDSGQLLFFGPANVHKPSMNEQLCADEITDCFKQHFEHCEHHSEQLFYLDSPLDSQRRQETLLFLDARGITQRGETAEAADKSTEIRFTPELEQYKVANATYYQILSHIDRDMSFRELATILEQNYGFEPDESLYYAETFIRKIMLELK